MTIGRHSDFKKAYKKRCAGKKNLKARVAERIALFTINPRHPFLKDHALTGTKNHLRAFSVGGDMRVVYYPMSKDKVLFLDIGTHNQVY